MIADAEHRQHAGLRRLRRGHALLRRDQRDEGEHYCCQKIGEPEDHRAFKDTGRLCGQSLMPFLLRNSQA